MASPSTELPFGCCIPCLFDLMCHRVSHLAGRHTRPRDGLQDGPPSMSFEGKFINGPPTLSGFPCTHETAASDRRLPNIGRFWWWVSRTDGLPNPLLDGLQHSLASVFLAWYFSTGPPALPGFPHTPSKAFGRYCLPGLRKISALGLPHGRASQ